MTNIFYDKVSCKNILALAWPLILVTCSNVIQQFVDKIFLAHYSQEALAAVMPSGMFIGVIVCLFTGTVSYVANFVAQYRGSNNIEKIPRIVNQAIFVSIIFGIICFFFCFAGHFIFFKLAKHDPVIAQLEVDYFKPMIYFAFLPIVMSAYSSFFTGIEKPKIILWINIIITVFNIFFDYVFIFGKFGCKEMGVAGAGWATQTGTGLGLLCLILVYYSKKYREEYNTCIKWKLELNLIKKLFRYGIPSGFQVTMDFLVWTIFIFFIGRLSIVELAASNIAFQVDQIAFMPILGVGTAVSILIANELGKKEQKSMGNIIKSAMFMSGCFDVLVIILFVFLPKLLISPFIDFSNPDQDLIEISVILLRILSIYVVVDAFGIILASVLRGAGDTMFIMWSMFILGVIFIITPSYIATIVKNLYLAWGGVVVYIFMLCIVFIIRVKQGKWKKIKITA